MNKDAPKSGRYRERAAELRAVATWMKNPEALRQMLATALEYERMADAVDKLEKKSDRDAPDPNKPTSH